MDTYGSMIFGYLWEPALRALPSLPGFIPLGESLRDPKDVLLSNGAEFIKCPPDAPQKKSDEADNEGITAVIPHVFGWKDDEFRLVSQGTILAKSRHETPRSSEFVCAPAGVLWCT